MVVGYHHFRKPPYVYDYCGFNQSDDFAHHNQSKARSDPAGASLLKFKPQRMKRPWPFFAVEKKNTKQRKTARFQLLHQMPEFLNTFLTLEATGHFRRQFGIVKASGESLDSNLIIDFPSIKSNRKPFCVFFPPKKTTKTKKTHRFLKTPQN